MNLPNKLTVARIAMVPLFVLLMSFEHVVSLFAGYVVFIVASITDYYDGKIARERQLVTNFGKLLDPVADKILVVSAFLMLMLLDGLWVPGWVVVVIVSREFLVTGGRALAASEGIVISANRVGKTKVVLQMAYIYCFLGFLILQHVLSLFPLGRFVEIYAAVLQPASLWAAVALALFTAYSGVQFAVVNWHALQLDRSL